MERNHAVTIANHIGYLLELAWRQRGGFRRCSWWSILVGGAEGANGDFELKDG